MEFILSPEIRELIEQATGLTSAEMQSNSILQEIAAERCDSRKNDKSDINPRGSVLLYLKRILPLKVVNKYIDGI